MTVTHRTYRSRRAAIGLAMTAAVLSAPLILAGCTSTTQPTESSEVVDQLGVTVTVSDAWAKATDPGDTSDHAMSGVFGTLENHGDSDLTIEEVSSDVAGHVELHEVVDGRMRAIQGDVTIPAGGSLVLEPGADHIMLMELSSALAPGDEVEITLSLSDSSSVSFIALVKDTSGANESYGDLDEGDHAEKSDAESHDAH